MNLIRHTEQPAAYVVIGMALASPAFALEFFREFDPEHFRDKKAADLCRAIKAANWDRAAKMLGIPIRAGEALADAVKRYVGEDQRRAAIERQLKLIEQMAAAAVLTGQAPAEFIKATGGSHARCTEPATKPVPQPKTPGPRIGG